MNSAGTPRRNEPSSIFVLLMQKYNVWLVFRNTTHWTGKFIVLIAAVMAPRCYRVRSSILNQSNWMTNKLCICLVIFLLLLLIVGCNRPIAASATPDLFATLQASTPSGFSTPAVAEPGETAIFGSPLQNAPLLIV